MEIRNLTVCVLLLANVSNAALLAAQLRSFDTSQLIDRIQIHI